MSIWTLHKNILKKYSFDITQKHIIQINKTHNKINKMK